MNEQLVRVLDQESDKIVAVPRSELAPGFVRVYIPGQGEVFIPTSAIARGEYQHPPFSQEIRDNLLEPIQKTFAEVRPLSIDQWEDGFRCDVHVEQEIAVWLHLAKAFRHFTRHLGPGPEEIDKKQDIFQLLLVCVNNGRENALATFSGRTLSRRRVKEIIDEFFHPQTWTRGG